MDIKNFTCFKNRFLIQQDEKLVLLKIGVVLSI